MTMRTTLLAAALASGSLFGTATLRADDKPTTRPAAGGPATQPAAAAATNAKCPVSGDAIDPAVTAVYNGKTYAFCCADCVKSFNKDPAKYAANAK